MHKIFAALLAGLVIFAGDPSHAGSGVNSEVYKKAYKEMIDKGKSGHQAKLYAQGFTEAKESGLTDSRSKEYAAIYVRAYNSAREEGVKCPHDCEAYASDAAFRTLKSR